MRLALAETSFFLEASCHVSTGWHHRRNAARMIGPEPRRCPMAALFEEDGIQLLYPENWELQREEGDNGWTIALQSPETAFLVLSFDAGMPEMELMAQTALDVLRGEYKDLE